MDWLVIAVGLGGALCVVLAFGLGRWLERRAETRRKTRERLNRFAGRE